MNEGVSEWVRKFLSKVVDFQERLCSSSHNVYVSGNLKFLILKVETTRNLRVLRKKRGKIEI